jgi:uncharacterized protein
MDGSPDLTLRQRSLLVFIGISNSGQLDPIRIMKGQFLIAMETPAEWLPADARYEFQPYNYGPYAPPIYTDLHELERSGLVTSRQALGQSWGYFSVTDAGKKTADAIAAAMPPQLVEYIASIRKFVTSLSFSQLLSAVYKRYPEYAVNSVFKRE